MTPNEHYQDALAHYNYAAAQACAAENPDNTTQMRREALNTALLEAILAVAAAQLASVPNPLYVQGLRI